MNSDAGKFSVKTWGNRALLAVITLVLALGAAREASAHQQQQDPLPLTQGRYGDLDPKYASDGTLIVTSRATGKSAIVPAKSAPEGVAGGNLNRQSSYDDLIVENARLNNVRPDLVRAVVKVESGFNPSARSPKGAMGLMQLMPATARQFNVSNPYDPEQNIRGGSLYLRQLLDRYDNNEALALAAYNAGPGAVDKYGQTIPPYRETKQYVRKVSEMADEGEEEAVKKAGTKFYKVVEIIDGREVVTYTNNKPR